MISCVMVATAALPAAVRSASRPPVSSMMTKKRSMVMVRITKGSRPTAMNSRNPSLLPTRAKNAKADDDQRQDDRQSRDQQKAKLVNPAPNNISDQDNARKDSKSIGSPVLRKASAIRTGMKIPKVGKPTTFRNRQIMSAPMGTRRRMRKVS